MTCTTHHNACDRREAAHAAEVERLTAIVAAADALRSEVARAAVFRDCPACDRPATVDHATGCPLVAYDLARGER